MQSIGSTDSSKSDSSGILPLNDLFDLPDQPHEHSQPDDRKQPDKHQSSERSQSRKRSQAEEPSSTLESKQTDQPHPLSQRYHITVNQEELRSHIYKVQFGPFQTPIQHEFLFHESWSNLSSVGARLVFSVDSSGRPNVRAFPADSVRLGELAGEVEWKKPVKLYRERFALSAAIRFLIGFFVNICLYMMDRVRALANYAGNSIPRLLNPVLRAGLSVLNWVFHYLFVIKAFFDDLSDTVRRLVVYVHSKGVSITNAVWPYLPSQGLITLVLLILHATGVLLTIRSYIPTPQFITNLAEDPYLFGPTEDSFLPIHTHIKEEMLKWIPKGVSDFATKVTNPYACPPTVTQVVHHTVTATSVVYATVTETLAVSAAATKTLYRTVTAFAAAATCTHPPSTGGSTWSLWKYLVDVSSDLCGKSE